MNGRCLSLPRRYFEWTLFVHGGVMNGRCLPLPSFRVYKEHKTHDENEGKATSKGQCCRLRERRFGSFLTICRVSCRFCTS